VGNRSLARNKGGNGRLWRGLWEAPGSAHGTIDYGYGIRGTSYTEVDTRRCVEKKGEKNGERIIY